MEQPPLLWLLGTSQICPLAVAVAMQQLALGVVRPHPCHCRDAGRGKAPVKVRGDSAPSRLVSPPVGLLVLGWLGW